MYWIIDKMLKYASTMCNIPDPEIEELWRQFEDVPMNPITEEIEEGFLFFPIGTSREEIWHWFDEQHSMGINYLLYEMG